jgi:hypothetical protein
VFLPDDDGFAKLLPWSMDFLESLDDNQLKSLTGNSMSMPAVGQVLLFALLGCALRDQQL